MDKSTENFLLDILEGTMKAQIEQAEELKIMRNYMYQFLTLLTIKEI